MFSAHRKWQMRSPIRPPWQSTCSTLRNLHFLHKISEIAWIETDMMLRKRWEGEFVCVQIISIMSLEYVHMFVVHSTISIEKNNAKERVMLYSINHWSTLTMVSFHALSFCANNQTCSRDMYGREFPWTIHSHKTNQNKFRLDSYTWRERIVRHFSKRNKHTSLG